VVGSRVALGVGSRIVVVVGSRAVMVVGSRVVVVVGSGVVVRYRVLDSPIVASTVVVACCDKVVEIVVFDGNVVVIWIGIVEGLGVVVCVGVVVSSGVCVGIEESVKWIAIVVD